MSNHDRPTVVRARLTAAALALLLAAPHAFTASIAVNPSTTYQTIEGLGAFGAIDPGKVKEGPFWIDRPYDEHVDMLVYDMGISMVRFELAPTYQPEPGTYNPDGTVFGGPTVAGDIRDMKAFIDRGVDRFIQTVWSPPG